MVLSFSLGMHPYIRQFVSHLVSWAKSQMMMCVHPQHIVEGLPEKRLTEVCVDDVGDMIKKMG